MSGQEYYAASQGQSYQHQQPYSQQYPGANDYGAQQPAYPSQHQYPNAYPPQQGGYAQSAPYGQPHQQHQQQSLAPYGAPQYGDRSASHSPVPGQYQHNYGSQGPYANDGTPAAGGFEDGGAEGAVGERGLGTKIMGFGAGAMAAKKLGHAGFFGTLAAGIGGAIAAEKMKGYADGRRDVDAYGNPVAAGVGAQAEGGYDPARWQQQYAQQSQQQPYQQGASQYGQPQQAQAQYGKQQQQQNQYPGQPSYT